mgnify:CR=1 FL=1
MPTSTSIGEASAVSCDSEPTKSIDAGKTSKELSEKQKKYNDAVLHNKIRDCLGVYTLEVYAEVYVYTKSVRST